MKECYIGTSGYSYAYWKNRFYPEGLSASKQLDYYSRQFNTVELNYTFYKFPTVKALQKSAMAVPDEFLFSLKVNKSITHTMRMQQAKDTISEFMDIVHLGLENKLGCVLFQLPPSYSFSEQRLEDILEHVSHQSSNVIEFRHASWWQENVYKAFKESGLTFCAVSFPGLPDDNIITSDIFYKRMHGVPELFKSAYDDEAIRHLASDMPEDKNTFVYFNNTMFEAGYSNARLLNQFVAEMS